jgi:hypothetical protein
MAEVPSACEKLLASARIVLTEAAMHDKSGNKVAAFHHYKRGVLEMSAAADNTKSKKFRAEIHQKLRPYLDRTEQLMKECPELEQQLKKYEADLRSDRLL